MKLLKVYSFGQVLNEIFYEKLKEIELNNPHWIGLGEKEFQDNREWWVYIDKGIIVGYFAHSFVQYSPTNHYVYFTRAWVKKEYRGKGLQKKMIKVRVRRAGQLTNTIITYTMRDNFPSINSLTACGFKIYEPEFQYIDADVLYFIKKLHIN